MKSNEDPRAFEAALAQLSERDQIVIRARDVDGLEWDAVVRLLGCPSEAIAREQHRRARIRLRDELGDGGAGDGVPT